MKRVLTILAAALMVLTVNAQNLNVSVGDVTYKFPASQTGEMTYTDGTTLTIMGKEFAISDITAMKIDFAEVTDNLVTVVQVAEVAVPAAVTTRTTPIPAA